MGKVVKGIVLGGAVGAGFAVFQAKRNQEPSDVTTERVMRAGAEAAAVGGAVGLVLSWRARRRARKASVLESLKSREFGEAIAAARPAVEHALELARPRLEHAAEVVRDRAQEAADAARPKVEQARKAAKPKVEQARKEARKRVEAAADAARPYAEQAGERVSTAADVAKKRLAEGIDVGNGQVVIKVA